MMCRKRSRRVKQKKQQIKRGENNKLVIICDKSTHEDKEEAE